MKGKILTWDAASMSGIIAGDDGNRYNLQKSSYKSKGNPWTGLTVDFSTDGNEAREIYSASGTGLESGSAMVPSVIAIVLAALAFFIPGLGILFAIGALFFGFKARKQAKTDSNKNANILATIAVIAAFFSLFGALIIFLLLGGALGGLFL